MDRAGQAILARPPATVTVPARIFAGDPGSFCKAILIISITQHGTRPGRPPGGTRELEPR
jgi:hypothetical protein